MQVIENLSMYSTELSRPLPALPPLNHQLPMAHWLCVHMMLMDARNLASK